MLTYSHKFCHKRFLKTSLPIPFSSIPLTLHLQHYSPPRPSYLCTMSPSKPKVLLLGKIDQYATPPPSSPSHPHTTNPSFPSEPSKQAFSSLSSIADLVTPKATNREEFLKEARSGAFDGVKAAYRTFSSVSITGRIEGEVCEELGEKGLRFLCHNGE